MKENICGNLSLIVPFSERKANVKIMTKDNAYFDLYNFNLAKFLGILALYNGLTASLLRQLTYSTTRFAIYEAIKVNVKSETFYSKVAIAAFAGCAGGFVGTPADLVNVRMQNDMKLSPELRRK